MAPPAPSVKSAKSHHTVTPPPKVGKTLQIDSIDTSGSKAPIIESTSSCNYERYTERYSLLNKNGKLETFKRLVAATPRPGLRICGLSFNTHFADRSMSGVIDALNLPSILKGPEYSTFTGDARLHLHLGEGILGIAGFSYGDFSTDGAPDASGGSGQFYVGLEHYTKDESAPVKSFGNAFRFMDHSAIAVGAGWSSLDGKIAPRIFLRSESDWMAIRGGNFRMSVQPLASSTSINFGGDGIESCKGKFCDTGSFFAPTTFTPLRLGLTYFLTPPSTAEDVAHEPGKPRPLGTEEFTYKLSERYFNELLGFIRRENVHQLIDVQAAMGTGALGFESSMAQYKAAGAGQGIFGFIEGWDRGGNAYMLGDMIRRGKTWVLYPELGILGGYILGAGFSKGMPSPEEFSKGETGGFSDFRGASSRMGVLTQGSQMALMGLDALGATGNPEEGGALFHSTNGAFAALGALGVWFARPLSGNGYGKGVAGNTIFADASPFFDGRSGSYDLYNENYLWTRQRMYGVHAVSSMLLGYAVRRELVWAGYQLEKSEAFDTTATAPKAKPSGLMSSLDINLDILPGGGYLSLTLHN